MPIFVHTKATCGAWRLCYNQPVRHRASVVLASAYLLFSCQPAQQAETKKADLVVPGTGPVNDLVVSAQRLAAKEGRRIVVYVGATWCEPCKYFLESVKTGSLPAHFADLRFLKFDNDTDEQRLEAAGYGGQMIPRFVIPAADGAGTHKRFEGSTKGPQAMDNIVPRLERILAH